MERQSEACKAWSLVRQARLSGPAFTTQPQSGLAFYVPARLPCYPNLHAPHLCCHAQQHLLVLRWAGAQPRQQRGQLRLSEGKRTQAVREQSVTVRCGQRRAQTTVHNAAAAGKWSTDARAKV